MAALISSSILNKLGEVASYTVRGGFIDKGEKPKVDDNKLQEFTNQLANIPMPSKETEPTVPSVEKTPVVSGREADPTSFPGVDIIKDFEKLKLSGYYATDEEKERGLVTVGYGNTGKVKFGEKISEEQANTWFSDHLRQLDVDLDKSITADLTNEQLGAIRSLVYNVGISKFNESKALKLLNKGDFEGFKREAFGHEHGFVFQAGKRLEGLVRRRKVEQDLFDSGTPAPAQVASNGE